MAPDLSYLYWENRLGSPFFQFATSNVVRTGSAVFEGRFPTRHSDTSALVFAVFALDRVASILAQDCWARWLETRASTLRSALADTFRKASAVWAETLAACGRQD